MADYAVVRIKAGKERATINRHPWIFSGAIDSVDESSKTGSIVHIKYANGSSVGYGFYDAKSMIRCRVFHFSDDEGFIANKDFWQKRIQRAWKLRAKHILEASEGDTTACRLIHAEGDEMPGIIADLYGDTLVVEYGMEGSWALREELNPIFMALPKVKKVIERFKYDKNDPTEPYRVTFYEHGIIYEADVHGGQKTGFFLDQRDSRLLIRQYSKAQKVLNTFSYSGGFSLNALAGGASKVDSVDLSAKALEEAEKNMELNASTLLDAVDRHQCIKSDAFDYLKNMEEGFYDLIVLDPPAFTKHRKTVPQASRGYKELNLKAFSKIASGGVLFTYSCSQHIDRDLFRKIVFSAAADAGRSVRILHQIGHGLDHPINIFHPENEYLKGLVLLVE